MVATTIVPDNPTLTVSNPTADGFDVTFTTAYSAAPAACTVSTELNKVTVSASPSSPSQSKVFTIVAASGSFHVSMSVPAPAQTVSTYATITLVNGVGASASTYYQWVKP